jgi:hypothetical protein
MAYLTTDDVYNLVAADIRTRFPEVDLQFEVKTFYDRSELWVYVLDRKRLKEVDEYCRWLAKRPMEPNLPRTILVKTWSGPWPGGESEQTIRERRRRSLG